MSEHLKSARFSIFFKKQHIQIFNGKLILFQDRSRSHCEDSEKICHFQTFVRGYRKNFKMREIFIQVSSRKKTKSTSV